jgi:hypothetical protein
MITMMMEVEGCEKNKIKKKCGKEMKRDERE